MNSEQQKVRKFYKEFLSWKAESVGMWLGAGIVETMFVISMMVPYQEMKYDMGFVALPWTFGWLGAMLYINPYLIFREEQNSVSIYEKLKYLPIDYREIKKMRTIYLIKFVMKIFPAAFVCQIAFSYFLFQEITFENIVYAVLTGLIWPIASNLPYVWHGK